jgi:predicted Rossmann fold nucleotide-binding protein DprA/Smf involved in DNA uptake
MAYLSRDSRAAQTHSSLEQRILDHLKRESLDIDALARVLGVSAGQLGTTLSLMQLNGLITEEAGLYYCK